MLIRDSAIACFSEIYVKKGCCDNVALYFRILWQYPLRHLLKVTKKLTNCVFHILQCFIADFDKVFTAAFQVLIISIEPLFN